MGSANKTGDSTFILLGLSHDPGQQRLFFVLFLVLYLVTLGGNLLIILAIGTNSHLHSPMYFFLANLSLVDICFSSTTVPKMLVDLQTGRPAISYTSCLTQLYFLVSLVALDNLLLTAMAYDRYMAICHPLRYTTVMSPGRCALLLTMCWTLSVLYGLTHTALMDTLSFCASRGVGNIFCEMYALLRLSCSDTRLNQAMLLATGSLLFITPFLLVLLSYTHIAMAISRVSSAQGKSKAFSTCGSHLTVVSLFYGTLFGVYLQPLSNYSVQDTVATVLYAVVTPLLNPFIYSLRNRDLHQALRKLILRRATVLQ
ncbi:olfactory receptor 1D2-like [Ornithorhynchus anatinus]|uniref:olfactory receptor 1D2-like n=1 Tax=Ornithorhynchus anatinus TaxID=9258 RepID=UPI0010A76BA0|nr:olfactory receptor 1D2-like [Ornithorhynchus anatinus]